MVIPRSRSSSMESSTWARMARGPTVCVSSRIRSASVDLPWSMWAMIEKLRMWAWSAITARVFRDRSSDAVGDEAREQPQLLQRGTTGDSHRQEPAENRDRVDRLAPLLVPVVVLQVEPKREL